MLPTRVLWYGVDQPLPAQVPLRAGPLTLVYEAGDLRYVRLGAREILRRVYVAVRDRNWGTVPGVRSGEQLEIQPDAFRITYTVDNRQGEIDFRWTATITGEPDGTIRFEMDGTARSTFMRNRIGICVLHPAECAGAEMRVEHVDGAVQDARLPLAIDPDQPVRPFTDIRALSHEVEPGVRARVQLDGDAFEMEDQRNWTDASFKTFSTPLRLPFPVEVPAGTRIQQALTLTLEAARSGPSAPYSASSAQPPTFSLEPGALSQLPAIGLGRASRGQPLSEREVARLRALRLAHLRAGLDLRRPDVEAALAQAAQEARALGVGLELALLLPDEPERELEALRRLLDRLRPPVAAWLVYAANERLLGGTPIERIVAAARARLADYQPGAPFAAGSNADFIFVGRNPPPAALLERICTAVSPQVHAFDLASVTETLQAQGTLVRSAQQTTGLPVAISPVTLMPRHNPYATGAAPEPEPGQLPPQVDVRQMSLYGAAWTLGSIKYLAEAGAASVTYYETTGWRGVMETEAGSPLPDLFRSIPGAVFPLYHVLADVGEFAGGHVVASRSSAPLRFDGLALQRGARTRLLLASFADEPQRVLVSGLRGALSVQTLDASSAEQAMRSPELFRAQAGEPLAVDGELAVALPPFALVRIDAEE